MVARAARRAAQNEQGAALRARSKKTPPTEQPDEQADGPVNEVRLRGRWTGATERELPSGDQVVTARVVVPRDEGGVDTIDCALWPAVLRRRSLLLPEGQLVHLEGRLHRRFWRTPAGPASRYEVEVLTLRRVSTPAATSGVP